MTPNRKGVTAWMCYMLIFATACSAWVGLMFVLTHGDSLRVHGLSLLETIGLYYASAIVTALIVGLLNPFATTRPLGVAVAICAMIPVAFLVSLTTFPGLTLIRALKGSLLLGGILGTIYGLVMWER